MSSPPSTPALRTRIWLEEPETDNDFAARSAHCHGYDVFGEMLGGARWVDMLYLLFRGEAPSPDQARLLEALAVALANAGPRDPAVHAAMCAGVGGSPAGATLMAALAVGAGQSGGAREVFLVVQAWAACGTDLDAWRALIDTRPAAAPSVWPELDHPPGFDPHARRTAGTVAQMLDGLARHSSGAALPWLAAQREALEAASGRALSATAVAAAAFVDLGFSAEQAEMLFLLMRLPGAAAHALEQRALGHKNFPFFSIDLLDDPARKAA